VPLDQSPAGQPRRAHATVPEHDAINIRRTRVAVPAVSAGIDNPDSSLDTTMTMLLPWLGDPDPMSVRSGSDIGIFGSHSVAQRSVHSPRGQGRRCSGWESIVATAGERAYSTVPKPEDTQCKTSFHYQGPRVSGAPLLCDASRGFFGVGILLGRSLNMQRYSVQYRSDLALESWTGPVEKRVEADESGVEPR
jgi:hypothetical protein